MRVLLVGAGRMGMRHLRGLCTVAEAVAVVDLRPEARVEAEQVAVGAGVAAAAFASLDEALGSGPFDAAVLGETAAARLGRLEAVLDAGVAALLVEKPLEQSRERVRAAAGTADAHGADVRVNHFLRGRPLVRELRRRGGPFTLTLAGGAYGLACNGIHWLDLAVFLAGGGGRVEWAALDATPIAGGRGPEFRDYGGRALVSFADGSTLFAACDATGSAPMQATVTQGSGQAVLLLNEGDAIDYARDPEAQEPVFRYGAGYRRREERLWEDDTMSASTAAWLRAVAGDEPHVLPTIVQSLPAHELLFDILELSGETHFPVT